MRMTASLVALLFPVLAAAQAADVRSLFEAGKSQEVVEAVAKIQAPDPGALFLAALSQQKLSNAEAAKALFSRLDGKGAWQAIGESGRLLAEGNVDGALAAANRAVAENGELALAHYQLGLVYVQKNDSTKAAAAFEKAAQLDPDFAYSHYHAGVAYSKAKRVDMMASHFEAFLKLAPDAPERAAVESIMRTVRGK